MFPSYGVQLIS